MLPLIYLCCCNALKVPLCVQRNVRSGVCGGVVVTAICTSKSELEFNVLSARRYVSMAQRKCMVGWGLKPTLGADNRATSEQINKRVRESAHTGNFARAWRGRRGPCKPL